MDPSEARALLEREMSTIRDLVGSVCRRYGLLDAEAEALESAVHLKLVEDDYGVLRRFSGRSSLRTYLAVIIANVHRDQRIRERGKWRPSALSRRLGPEAIQLDRLMNRDGVSLDEAVTRVANGAGEREVRELRRMAASLPRRPRRRFEPLEPRDLADAAATDAAVEDREDREDRERIGRLLERCLEGLPEKDRLLVRLRCGEDLTVPQIARILGLEAKPLYRRTDAALARLRACLEARGVDRRRVLELVDHE